MPLPVSRTVMMQFDESSSMESVIVPFGEVNLNAFDNKLQITISNLSRSKVKLIDFNEVLKS